MQCRSYPSSYHHSGDITVCVHKPQSISAFMFLLDIFVSSEHSVLYPVMCRCKHRYVQIRAVQEIQASMILSNVGLKFNFQLLG